MGFRLRKSVGNKFFRANISKSGFGYSFGVPGARRTRMSNGRSRNTLNIPGSGLSYVTESGGKKQREAAIEKYVDYDTNKRLLLLWKIVAIPAMVVGVLAFLLGLCMLTTNVGLGLTFAVIGIVAFFAGKSGRKHKKTIEGWIAEYKGGNQ